ncbi:MAG TPA: DUF4190 domain-containing protein [Candidatus Dormibacteraeota bacterium]|nr:DUF4190 domain-containing protein [Candidatus Dormibacteraeota bacterium]
MCLNAAVVSEPPAPQLSPDGKYQWDGQRWVPTQQQPLPSPQVSALQPVTPALAFASQVQPQPLLVLKPATNGLAIVSLIFGIISYLTCGVGSLVAIISGHIARSQIKRTGESGSGLAIAGLILAYISLGGWALFLLFWIVLFGGLATLLGGLGIAAPTPSP